VDWNSALWMTPLISGNVDAEGGHFEHNLRLVRILCQYFNAFMQTFQCSCEKALFADFER